MYLQHFGLRHAPLGKELTEPWDDGAVANLKQRFDWLLQSPGLGLLTGEPGVGKTAALRSITSALNPHRYLVLYQVRVHGVCQRVPHATQAGNDGCGPCGSADAHQPVGTAASGRGIKLGGVMLAMDANTASCMNFQRSTPWRRQVS